MTVVSRQRPVVRTRRIGAYIRVSTQEQVQGYGLPDQERAIRRYIDYNDSMILVRFFRDEGVTGTKRDRDGMLELEQAAERREIDAIMVQRVDRVGRSFSTFYHWVHRLKEELEIDFIAVEQGVDTSTDFGETWLLNLGQMAAMEHKLILDRTQGGKQMKAEAGGWPSGVPPFGYEIADKGTKGNRLAVKATEASVIERIAALMIDEGKSVEETVDMLNALGAKTKGGNSWTKQALYKLIKSDAIDGTSYFRRTHKTYTPVRTKLDRDGNPKFGTTVIIELPRILDSERVAALRACIKTRPKKPTDKIYPLSGHLSSPCGSNYVGHWDAPNERRRYRCNAKSLGRKCACPTFPAEDAEGAAWAILVRYFGDRDNLIALARQRLSELPSDYEKYAVRAETIKKQIKDRDDELNNAIRNFAVMNVRPDRAQKIIDEMQRDLDAAGAMLAETEAWLANYMDQSVEAHQFMQLAETAQFNLAHMDLEGQQRFIERLLIRIEFTEPFDSGQRTGTPCEVMKWHKATGAPVPSEITAEQWPAVRELLQASPTFWTSRTREELVQQAVNGALWRLRTGGGPKDFPAQYGRYGTAVKRMAAAWDAGLWPSLVELLDPARQGAPLGLSFGLPRMVARGKFSGELLALTSGDNDVSLPPDFSKSMSADTPFAFEVYAS